MSELSDVIGISRPTLSRYFQDPTSVRASTSAKIEERMGEVDYVYNFIATRQNRKSSGLIGVIIPHYEDLFFASLLEVIEAAARGAGYTVITQSSGGTATGEIAAVGRLRSMSVDGAIIAPLGLATSTEPFRRAREDFPIVFADSRPAEGIARTDFVGTDNAQSVASIVEYLCRTGDAPVFLRMPAVNTNAVERDAAYASTMRALGHEPRYVEVDRADPTWQFEAHGYGVMAGHFGRRRHVGDTILCANDRIAIGAIRAANQHGLFVRGGDGSGSLRIAGHDDHPLSRYVSPAITTSGQDVAGIGEGAMRLLVERIRGKEEGASSIFLKEAVLRVRESS